MLHLTSQAQTSEIRTIPEHLQLCVNLIKSEAKRPQTVVVMVGHLLGRRSFLTLMKGLNSVLHLV